MTRRRAPFVALLVLAAWLSFAALASGAARHPLATAIQDSTLLHTGPDGELAMQRVALAGATRVKVDVSWHEVAPAGRPAACRVRRIEPRRPALRLGARGPRGAARRRQRPRALHFGQRGAGLGRAPVRRPLRYEQSRARRAGGVLPGCGAPVTADRSPACRGCAHGRSGTSPTQASSSCLSRTATATTCRRRLYRALVNGGRRRRPRGSRRQHGRRGGDIPVRRGEAARPCDRPRPFPARGAVPVAQAATDRRLW